MKRTVEVDGSMVCIQMVNPNIALLSEFIETTKNLLNKEGFTKIDINLPLYVWHKFTKIAFYFFAVRLMISAMKS